MIDTLDSYFQFIKGNLGRIGASVTVAGVPGPQKIAQVIQARDWPMSPPIEGALYLLFITANRIGGTEAQNMFEYHCQWSWLLIGQDIQPTMQSSNRGDRYRSHVQIMENLRQAHNAGFCQKLKWTVSGTGVLSSAPVMSTYPESNIEMVTWSKLRFPVKQDNDKSGLIYGYAGISLYSYEDVDPRLAVDPQPLGVSSSEAVGTFG